MVVIRVGKKYFLGKAEGDLRSRRVSPPSRTTFVLLQNSRQVYGLKSACTEGGIGRCRMIGRSKWGADEKLCKHAVGLCRSILIDVQSQFS